MFVPSPGWWRGGPQLGPLGVWAGLRAALAPAAASRARPARPYSLLERSSLSESTIARKTPLKEWTLIVNPFGRLQARLPCDIAVRPLDPYHYPDADRVLVTVSGVEGGSLDLDSIHVRYDETLKQMAIISDSIDRQASVEVKVPLKFDLNIRTSGTGCVKVQEAECDDCRIETEQGNSIVQSVKSKKLHIQTKGGKVICLGTILGNTDIHATEKSTVTIDKLQGSSVNISTEDGLLKAEYLYTESSSLSSAAGDITLGSIHGDLTVHSKMGNITIDWDGLSLAFNASQNSWHIVDSLNGYLKASTHQGAVDVYVSQMGNVDLKSHKGSITIKVPSSLKAHLQLSGSKVDVNPEITLQEISEVPKDNGIIINGHMNQTKESKKWIKANAPNGIVYLKSQSWFQSLKLKDS
ncbi:protein FAM185A isoform X1 [Sarcophilus harrisii]|uniref:protein FAM185A isoform X1 n=1 Tax=Sarcophilus harrisii TaxID=9305 RepID=UPI001301FB8F|nr:protein FAM185A isoform X1 [Sarcophilus harrisii]XP_031794554.1 protein FAM185A isoform X1 [Sarcophilus harrisii]